MMDMEPSAVGEPVAYGDAVGAGQGDAAAADPSAVGATGGAAELMTQEAKSLIDKGRADAASLRQELARAQLESEVVADLDASLESLDAYLAGLQSRLASDPNAASEMFADGTLSRLHARLETLEIVRRLVGALAH
jgi:hypothetical protein